MRAAAVDGTNTQAGVNLCGNDEIQLVAALHATDALKHSWMPLWSSSVRFIVLLGWRELRFVTCSAFSRPSPWMARKRHRMTRVGC